MSTLKRWQRGSLGLFMAVAACFDTSSVSLGTLSLPEDVAFIDDMVQRGEAAIAMIEAELQRGSRDDVRSAAQKLEDARLIEIAEMKAVRKELTGSSEVPPLVDSQVAVHVQELQSVPADDVDRTFLEHMIPHHAAAVQAARASTRKIQRDDLKDIAAQLVEEHTAETRELEAMLAERRPVLDALDDQE